MRGQHTLSWVGDTLVAGVDEAGRGPLAGPVVAAAVILDPSRPIQGLDDSKVLSASRRDALFSLIRARALCCSVAWADSHEVDALNILRATMLAMRRALLGLSLEPGHVQVDGNRCPSLESLPLGCTIEAIIGGDGKVPAISAASILAKVTRDEIMKGLDSIYPGYDFAGHKGYPTVAHRQVLLQNGPCPVHRRSFSPVSAAERRLA
jgi:ribonuclease HII